MEPPCPPPPPNAVDSKGFYTVRGSLQPVRIHFAINSAENEELRKQIELHNDLNYMFYGQTPLTLAISKENTEAAVMLINKGADVNISEKTPLRRYPIHIACQTGNYDVVKELINHGGNIHNVDNMGFTALHYICCFCKDTDLLDLLLEAGCHVNVVDDRGRSPLFRAAEAGNLEYVRILYENGGSLNIPDKYGWIALHHTVICNNEEMAERLISYGSDLQRCDLEGNTIMHAAVDRLCGRNLRVLASTSTNFSTRNHSAVSRSTNEATSFIGVNESLIYSLLNCGAPINAVSIHGDTPLKLAAEGGYVNVVKMLVSCGANLFNESWIHEEARPPSIQRQPDICSWLLAVGSMHVKTLKLMCKISIRECLYPHANDKLPCLPLPCPLQEYLDILTE